MSCMHSKWELKALDDTNKLGFVCPTNCDLFCEVGDLCSLQGHMVPSFFTCSWNSKRRFLSWGELQLDMKFRDLNQTRFISSLVTGIWNQSSILIYNVQCKKVLWVSSWGSMGMQQRNQILKCNLKNISYFEVVCCKSTKEKLGSTSQKVYLPFFSCPPYQPGPCKYVMWTTEFLFYPLKKHSD